MGTQSGAHNDGPMAEINITPFTDVLLVLLIIFMILASLNTPPGFQKDLTQQCVVCSGHHPTKNIEVSITAAGATTIDGERVTLSTVYDRMSETVRFHSSRTGYSTHITVVADRAAPYGSLITVLDAAREAGDDDVGLVNE